MNFLQSSPSTCLLPNCQQAIGLDREALRSRRWGGLIVAQHHLPHKHGARMGVSGQAPHDLVFQVGAVDQVPWAVDRGTACCGPSRPEDTGCRSASRRVAAAAGTAPAVHRATEPRLPESATRHESPGRRGAGKHHPHLITDGPGQGPCPSTWQVPCNGRGNARGEAVGGGLMAQRLAGGSVLMRGGGD